MDKKIWNTFGIFFYSNYKAFKWTNIFYYLYSNLAWTNLDAFQKVIDDQKNVVYFRDYENALRLDEGLCERNAYGVKAEDLYNYLNFRVIAQNAEFLFARNNGEMHFDVFANANQFVEV